MMTNIQDALSGRVVAERSFTTKSGTPVRLTICLPEQLGSKPGYEEYHPSDWTCEFRIEGLGEERVHREFGVDSLQALMLALSAAGRFLQLNGPEVAWLGEEGNLGFPLEVPASLGKRFLEEIRQKIDEGLQSLTESTRAEMAKRDPRPSREILHEAAYAREPRKSELIATILARNTLEEAELVHKFADSEDPHQRELGKMLLKSPISKNV